MTVSFLSTAILARLLSPTDFGVVAASLIAVGLATAVFEGAFAIGLVQRAEVDDEYLSSAFWLSLILACVLIGVIALASTALTAFFNVGDYGPILVVSSSCLLFKAAESVAVAYMRRASRFGSIALSQFSASLLGYGPVAIYLAWQGWGPWALVVGQLVTSVFAGGASLALSRMPLRFTLTSSATRDIVQSSGYFTASQVLNWSALSGANAVIAHMLGVKSLGLYSRSWKLLDMLTSVTAAPLSSVLVPAYARMQNDAERARKALEKSLSVAVVFFAIVSALVVTKAAAIVDIALGPTWTECVPMVQVLFAALVPRCCYKVTESITIGFGRSKSAALRQALYAALVIGGAVVAAPFGPVWVALSTSCAITLFYLTSLAYSARLVKLSASAVVRIHVRGLAFAIIAIGADAFVSSLLPAEEFWWGEASGLCAGIAALVLSFYLGPKQLLGEHLIHFRERILARGAVAL